MPKNDALQKIVAISGTYAYHPPTSQPPHRTIAIVELHLSLTQSIQPRSRAAASATVSDDTRALTVPA